MDIFTHVRTAKDHYTSISDAESLRVPTQFKSYIAYELNEYIANLEICEGFI